ncbi:serine/threonine-protein kinase MARK1-like [Anopheles marshallii]|uniref:serine/threonine-protein kinase MARK1-like n=1 Tax=Anopheles marshallii TaxID=1521116 RepID=UPI00237C09AD|nr:serine/threonine-protein kinase MARK1-like [Anopheles marshallii]
MFRARKQLGKRQTADSGNGFRPKKFRTDQQVPTIDEGQRGATDGTVPDGGAVASGEREGEDATANMSKYARRIVRGQTGNVVLDCEIPRYGTPVERKRCRKAGDFVIGYELGTSPGVPQTQYLARKQDSNEFYLLKILSFDPETEIVDKETLQGKVLLHNEFTLLSMLDDLDGVIHQHGFFSDYAFEERQVERDDGTVQSIYTGRIRRRLILVLDCVHAHEFCDESSAFISLQRHISVARLSERDALELFYEVVKVVEQLHARNIIHRDLKLNNIVLDRRTGRIVLTNFFLGKHLINEQECLFDQRGSPAYISPDVLGGKPYRGKPSDMWALGVILYTIVYGKFPFLDTTPSALFRKIREADYTIPSGFNTTHETKSLIKRMLTLNPDERLTACEVRIELETNLRKFRRPRMNCDQLVPEIVDVVPSLAALSFSSDKPAAQGDQSIPTGKEPVAGSSTVAPTKVDTYVNGSVKKNANPSPKFDLSAEPFSRILEANVNQCRAGETSKPKGERTFKVKTTTYRFTPTSMTNQLYRQHDIGEVVAEGLLSGGSPNSASSEQQPTVGGRRSNASTTSATASGTGEQSTSSNAGRNWSRFNFNLNLQYSASSYNSAARAVAAAIAAVHNVGTSSAMNRARMERIRNDPNGNRNGSNATNDRPSLPRLVSVSQTVRTVRSANGLQNPQQVSAPSSLPIAGPDATGPEPFALDQTVNRPSLGTLTPAAQRLYSIMNYISVNNRGPVVGNNQPTTPATVPAVAPIAENDSALIGLDFNGIITPDMADKIVAYLIVNLRSLDWVANVFRSIDGGVNDAELRVNNLLELLRQLGVRMEACNGQIVIRAEQTRDRMQFLSLLLRIAGYNDKYFHQRSS